MFPETIAPEPTAPAMTAPEPKSNTPTVPDWIRRDTPKKPSTAPLAMIPEPTEPDVSVLPAAAHVKSSRRNCVPFGVPVTPSRPLVTAPDEIANCPIDPEPTLPLTTAPLPTVPATTAPEPRSNTPTVPEAISRVAPKKPCTAPLAMSPEPMPPEPMPPVPLTMSHVKSERRNVFAAGVPVTPSRPEVTAPDEIAKLPT